LIEWHWNKGAKQCDKCEIGAASLLLPMVDRSQEKERGGLRYPVERCNKQFQGMQQAMNDMKQSE